MPINVNGNIINSTIANTLGSTGIPQNGLVLNLDASVKNSYAGSGEVWYDMSGYGNNGTLVGGAVYQSPNSGSIYFDGVDDWVNIPDSPSLKMQYQMSISCWFSIPQNGLPYRQALISKHYSNYELGIYEDGRIHTYTRNGIDGTFPTYNEGNAAYHKDGVWQANRIYHVVWTLDGATETTWYGGELAATGSQYTKGNFGTNDNGDTLQLGTRFGGLIFKGNMYSVQIWNRALTFPEVQQLYNTQKTKFGL